MQTQRRLVLAMTLAILMGHRNRFGAHAFMQARPRPSFHPCPDAHPNERVQTNTHATVSSPLNAMKDSHQQQDQAAARNDRGSHSNGSHADAHQDRQELEHAISAAILANQTEAVIYEYDHAAVTQVTNDTIINGLVADTVAAAAVIPVVSNGVSNHVNNGVSNGVNNKHMNKHANKHDDIGTAGSIGQGLNSTTTEDPIQYLEDCMEAGSTFQECSSAALAAMTASTSATSMATNSTAAVLDDQMEEAQLRVKSSHMSPQSSESAHPPPPPSMTPAKTNDGNDGNVDITSNDISYLPLFEYYQQQQLESDLILQDQQHQLNQTLLMLEAAEIQRDQYQRSFLLEQSTNQQILTELDQVMIDYTNLQTQAHEQNDTISLMRTAFHDYKYVADQQRSDLQAELDALRTQISSEAGANVESQIASLQQELKRKRDQLSKAEDERDQQLRLANLLKKQHERELNDAKAQSRRQLADLQKELQQAKDKIERFEAKEVEKVALQKQKQDDERRKQRQEEADKKQIQLEQQQQARRKQMEDEQRRQEERRQRRDQEAQRRKEEAQRLEQLRAEQRQQQEQRRRDKLKADQERRELQQQQRQLEMERQEQLRKDKKEEFARRVQEQKDKILAQNKAAARNQDGSAADSTSIQIPSPSLRIATPDSVPIINDWVVQKSGEVTGTVSNHPEIDDGTDIITSRLANPRRAAANTVVATQSGSNYKLGSPLVVVDEEEEEEEDAPNPDANKANVHKNVQDDDDAGDDEKEAENTKTPGISFKAPFKSAWSLGNIASTLGGGLILGTGVELSDEARKLGLTGQSLADGKYMITAKSIKSATGRSFIYTGYRIDDNQQPILDTAYAIKVTSNRDALRREYENYQKIRVGANRGVIVHVEEFLERADDSSKKWDKMSALVMEKGEEDLKMYRYHHPDINDDVIGNILLSALKCLQHVHSVRLVWTDLKTENIILTGEDEFKAIDFESAMPLKSNPMDYTPEACPPEFAKAFAKEEAYDFVLEYSYDVWSFGMLAYEMATGKGYFDGKTPDQIMAALARLEHLEIAEQSQGAIENKDLLQMIQSCLHMDPRKRPTIQSLMRHSFFSNKNGGGGGGLFQLPFGKR